MQTYRKKRAKDFYWVPSTFRISGSSAAPLRSGSFPAFAPAARYDANLSEKASKRLLLGTINFPDLRQFRGAFTLWLVPGVCACGAVRCKLIGKSEQETFLWVSYSLRVFERQLYRRRKAHKNPFLAPLGTGIFYLAWKMIDVHGVQQGGNISARKSTPFRAETVYSSSGSGKQGGFPASTRFAMS